MKGSSKFTKPRRRYLEVKMASMGIIRYLHDIDSFDENKDENQTRCLQQLKVSVIYRYPYIYGEKLESIENRLTRILIRLRIFVSD